MLLQAFVCVALATVLFLAAKCTYNLFLHPLRHYPGPLLCRASRVFYLYYDVRGVSHRKVKQWHERYGDAIRISPDELSFTNPDVWSSAYGFGSNNFDKDPQWWNKNVGGVDNILTADDAGHRRMRRLQNPAFSDKALRAQEPVLNKYVDLLMHQLHGQCSGEGVHAVDLNLWYNFLTFDLIGDLAFGEPFYCLRDGEWHWWLTAVFEIFKVGTFIRAARRFPNALYYVLLMIVIPKKLLETRQKQYMFGVERVNRRLEQTTTTERQDFMKYILQADGEKGMTLEEMYTAAQVLIVAGSETTATALTAGTYYLLANRGAYTRLRDEVLQTFTSEKDISIHSTQRSLMPFLSALVDETLRIFPPGPGAFPRVVPEGGRTLLGRFVPGGTSVGVHALSASRSGRNFALADEFHPERWLGEREDVFGSDRRAATQPFSFGPRNCIGRSLALAELRVTFARMIWNFDMELCEETQGWPDRQRVFTIWEKPAMRVRLSSRKHVHVV